MPATPRKTNTPPPDKTGTDTSAKRLACSAAASVVSRERKWFDRQAKGEMTEEQLANFKQWHTDLVQQATDANAVAVQSYMSWREVNKQADAEAREKLAIMCLEAQ